MKSLTRCEVLGAVQDLVSACLETKEFGSFTITVRMSHGNPVAVSDDIGLPFTPVPLEMLTAEKYW